MPPLFNIIRTCVLAAVFFWTLIVLGLAAHFLNVLEASELTNYVPLAIFTATATLFVMSSLWIGSCARRPHPIFQTKYELAWLGALGILWLCLGAYTVSLPEVDVECFDDNGFEVDSLNGVSTDTYHAQSHAIQAFSILNGILLLLLFLLLLFLALRRNRRDPRRPVWAIPVTMIDWFGSGSHSPQKKKTTTSLPPPVTARVTVARRMTEPAKVANDKEVKPMVEVKEHTMTTAPAPLDSRPQRNPSRGHQYVVWVPHDSTTQRAPTQTRGTTRGAVPQVIRLEPPQPTQARPTPGRSRSAPVPARNLPSTRERVDRDLPPPPTRNAPLPATTRNRPAPPARSRGVVQLQVVPSTTAGPPQQAAPRRR